MMGERDFSRSRQSAATDERCGRRAVVRGPEWSLSPAHGFEPIRRHRMHGCHLQCLAFGERRQDARETRSEHRLSRARRPDHQNAMAAGGGDFQRSFRLLLAFHLIEIRIGGRNRWRRCAVLRQAGLVREMALAGCTGMDVVSVLEKKRQDVRGVEVNVTGTQREDAFPHIYTDIEVEYVVIGYGVKPDAVARAIELSEQKYCSVKGMLGPEVSVRTSFRVVEARTSGVPLLEGDPVHE